MGSLNSSPPIILSVPTIDFSNSDLKPGNPKWESVKSQVRNAMEDYGCFSAIFSEDYHCDRQGFRIEIIPLLKSLFDVPEEKKKGIDRPYSYIPRRPESKSPLYESLAIDDASDLPSLEGFVNVLLPQGDPSSSETLRSFKEETSRIQEIIRRMLVESLGLEKYMEDHVSLVQHSLRMQKYEATSGSEIGLVPHTDPNTLTILYENEVPGLEIQTKDGHWVPVTPPPCSFTVLLAESFNAWANGRFHVPPHRVMIDAGSEARYSIGLFTRPKDGYTVLIPEEMVDEDHPLVYGHFNYSEYRKAQGEYVASGKGLPDLKAYCDDMMRLSSSTIAI